MIYHQLVLGDLHTNHEVGVHPPEFLRTGGAIVRSNPFAIWLWERYLETRDWVRDIVRAEPGHLTVSFNGDISDSPHHFNTHRMVVTERDDIERLAVAACVPFLDLADEVLVSMGTEVHAGVDNAIESAVARLIGATPMSDASPIWWPIIHQNVGGYRIDMSHHGRVGRGFNKLNQLGTQYQEVLNWYLNNPGFVAKHGMPQLVVFSHVHLATDSVNAFPGTRIITAPGFQGTPLYANRRPYGLADIGAVLITIEDGKLTNVRWKIHPINTGLRSVWTPTIS